jgi:hypothetical protein
MNMLGIPGVRRSVPKLAALRLSLLPIRIVHRPRAIAPRRMCAPEQTPPPAADRLNP